MGWTLGALPVAPDPPLYPHSPRPPPRPPAPRPWQPFHTCCYLSANPNTHHLHVCSPDSEPEAGPAHVASLGPTWHLHKIRVSCMKQEGVRWTSGRLCLSEGTRNRVRGWLLCNLPGEQEDRQHLGDPQGKCMIRFQIIFLLKNVKECCQVYAPSAALASVGEFGRWGWEGGQVGYQEDLRVRPPGGAHLLCWAPIHEHLVLKLLKNRITLEFDLTPTSPPALEHYRLSHVILCPQEPDT